MKFLKHNEFREPLEGLEEIILIHSPMEIIWCNMEVADLLGYSNPDELIGEKTEKIMETKTGDEGLVTFVKGDGSTVSCLTNHHLLDEDSEVKLSIIQPISPSNLKKGFNQLLKEVKHEVNTPLTVIKGYTELLHGRKLDPETRKVVDILARNIQRLEEATQKVLEKIEKD